MRSFLGDNSYLSSLFEFLPKDHNWGYREAWIDSWGHRYLFCYKCNITLETQVILNTNEQYEKDIFSSQIKAIIYSTDISDSCEEYFMNAALK